MKANKLLSCLAALGTVTIWGLTFISTKILLQEWSALEILFIRFLLGWLALCLLAGQKLKPVNGKHEILFILAGLTGVTLYFLLENIALTYTLASNVSVIVSTAPFFTGLLAWPLLKRPAPGLNFYIGFLMAVGGIYLMAFGASRMNINPMGDLLAILAALSWAFYSILTRMLTDAGYPSLAATRRIFLYGLILMLPFSLFDPISLKVELFLQPVYLFNMLFLGLGASALCFVSWTWCLKRLGATQASLWIYLVPVITVLAARIFLNEKMGLMAICGIALTLAGLAISENTGWKIFISCFKADKKLKQPS